MAIVGKDKRKYEARAQIAKALAHPTRLYIIEELARGENSVLALTRLIGADVSTVSKHLAVLKQAGIVADEKRGLHVWYQLRMPCILKFFDCAEEVLKARARLAQQVIG